MRVAPVALALFLAVSAAPLHAEEPADFKAPVVAASHAHETSHAACDSCSTCDPCAGARGRRGRVCVDNVHHHCGNLHPHYPYETYPRTYYYFRPYNHRHVFEQQQEAMQWGAPAGMPYVNDVFEQVYATLP